MVLTMVIPGTRVPGYPGTRFPSTTATVLVKKDPQKYTVYICTPVYPLARHPRIPGTPRYPGTRVSVLGPMVGELSSYPGGARVQFQVTSGRSTR
eukprot:3332626-Rhodomonas_salina.1